MWLAAVLLVAMYVPDDAAEGMKALEEQRYDAAIASFSKVAAAVTGGSFRSEHPLTARFGLGNADRVESVEIRWPGGAVTRLAEPKINQAHWIGAPKR